MAGIFSKFSNAAMRPYLMGLQFQSSVYGATVPQIYGRTRVPLYLTWANGLRKVETSSKPWWGYLFTGIGLLFRSSKEFYLENVTFLGGHNPIWGPLQAWSVDTKIPLDFHKDSIAISPGDATVVIPGADAGAAYPIGLTLTLPYSETFDDYGGFGPVTVSGTYELPVWNSAKAGPDPTDASAYRAWPYIFRNVPGVGPTFYLDQNALGAWPACTANLYYALRSSPDLANPVASLALTFEPELGDGPEYGSAYAAQLIIYPHYAGLGSDGLLLTAGLGMPNIRVELQGAFGVYGTGDADFTDMIEDIFKGAQAQGGAGTSRARTDVQHGLGCYDYPGLVQKMIFQPTSTINPLTVTYDRANAAGDFLVVFASSATSASLGISDDAGNAWTPIFSGPLPYQGWYATAVAHAPGNRVTVTGLGASANVILLEVGGVDALDALATAAGSSSTASCSVTSTNAGGVPAFILAWTNLDVGQTLPTLAPGSRWPTLISGLSHQWAQGRAVWFPGTYVISNAGVTPGAWRMAVLAFKASQPPSYPRPLGNVLDRTTLALTRDQCRAYGLYGSASLDSQKKAADWLAELYQAANAAAVWSGFRLKSVPYAEASAVGNGAVYRSPTSTGPVAQLGPCDFVGDASRPMIVVERKAQVDAPNILQMQHPNRDSDYNHVVTAQTEQSALSLYGPRKQSPRVFMWVQDSGVARMLLGVEVRRLNYFRNLYKFTLNAKHKLLEAMDLVEITDPLAGIAAVPVRLTKVVENAGYDLDCEAKDFIYGAESPSTAQSAATTPSPNPVPAGVVPASVNAPVIFQPVVRLSSQQSQVWFIVSDADVNYGGCLVYISTDGGASYQPLGAINGNGVTGVTVGTWPAGADPDTTNDLALNLSESLGVLSSYAVVDEDNFVYPCYVAGGAGVIPYELMAYAAANLTSAYHYTLKATGGGTNHLRRAVFGAPTVGAGVSHAGGSRFAFLDPAGKGMLKVALDPAWVGKTLYFKFPAFNQFGGGVQPLVGLTAYPFTPYDLGGGGPNPNNTDYTVDPCPCLSQPSGTLNVNVAVTTAHFPTNDASYGARAFTVADPGGGSTSIPPTTDKIVTSIGWDGAQGVVKVTASHGLSNGNQPLYAVQTISGQYQFYVDPHGPITVIDATSFSVDTVSGASGVLNAGITARGTGYVPGDTITIDPTGQNVTAHVTSVDGVGGVTDLEPIIGNLYGLSMSELLTSGGSGSGLKLLIYFFGYPSAVVHVVRGAVLVAVTSYGTTLMLANLIDVDDIGLSGSQPIVVAGVADSRFNGTFTGAQTGRLIQYYVVTGAVLIVVSGGGTVTGGGGGTQVYYVTVYDPGFVGDAQGARPAYCETTQAKVGVVGYTYLGSIYVTHTGGAVLVTCGGWPAPQEFLVNGS